MWREFQSNVVLRDCINEKSPFCFNNVLALNMPFKPFGMYFFQNELLLPGDQINLLKSFTSDKCDSLNLVHEIQMTYHFANDCGLSGRNT